MASYDVLVARGPTTTLSLEHEVFSESSIFLPFIHCSYSSSRNVCICFPPKILPIFHCDSFTSHKVIPYAIQKLKGAGYNLVTVAECLGMQPYQSVGATMAQQAVSCTKYLIIISPSFTDFLM